LFLKCGTVRRSGIEVNFLSAIGYAAAGNPTFLEILAGPREPWWSDLTNNARSGSLDKPNSADLRKSELAAGARAGSAPSPSPDGKSHDRG
jgi:hypothetical protein